jgi:hypothetical protein
MNDVGGGRLRIVEKDLQFAQCSGDCALLAKRTATAAAAASPTATNDDALRLRGRRSGGLRLRGLDLEFDSGASATAAHPFAAGSCKGITAEVWTVAPAENILRLILSETGFGILTRADHTAEFDADDFPFFIGGFDRGFGLGERIVDIPATAAGKITAASPTAAANASTTRVKSARSRRTAATWFRRIDENIDGWSGRAIIGWRLKRLGWLILRNSRRCNSGGEQCEKRVLQDRPSRYADAENGETLQPYLRKVYQMFVES